MIPQTVVGFFFFLFLVAPGFSYELLRGRRAPRGNQTAFREVARVALYSFGFSFSAFAIIAILTILFPKFLFDPQAFSNNSREYVKDHYTAIVLTFVLAVFIAFALVFIINEIIGRLLLRSTWSILRHRKAIWADILIYSVPTGTIPWLSIRLSDGSRIAGFLDSFTLSETFNDAGIVVKKGMLGPMLLIDTQDPNDHEEQKLGQEDLVWVRGDDIRYIKVTYLPEYAPEAIATVEGSEPEGKHATTQAVPTAEGPTAPPAPVASFGNTLRRFLKWVVYGSRHRWHSEL